MKYARIINNISVEIMDVSPVGIHNPIVASMFTECPDEIEVGWSFVGGVWIAPEPLPEPVAGPPTQFSGIAFMALVGEQNMVKLLTLAKTDVNAELMVLKINKADVIDFADEVNGPQRGMQYLLALGELTQDEYDRIMRREFL